MYDYIIVTLDSSFYKVNLYNELSKKLKILVVFLCSKNINRSDEFLNYKKNFEFIYLHSGVYEDRNSLQNSFKIIKILKTRKYKKLILGGWDSLENWISALFSPTFKNCLTVESSEHESSATGIKGKLKMFFLKNISLVFASGESQKKLVEKLNFKGEIKKTKGVGIFNTKNRILKEIEIDKIKKFIFVGGLIPVKNIEQLIRVFNKLPHLELTIVGTGLLEKELKSKSKSNIKFLGHIENKNLWKIYQKNHVLILPSKSEAWGLVVEEALFNGLPVILSNKVGCSTEVIENGKHGYIYSVDNELDLIEKINKIILIDKYNMLKKNIIELDFKKIMEIQVESYLL